MTVSFKQHVPVLAYEQDPDGGIQTPRPVIYGTAFPVAAGLFATAAHVVRSAKAGGTPGLSLCAGPGAAFQLHEIVEYEAVSAIDFALLRCPSLSAVSPIPIDFDNHLAPVGPVMAYGYPLGMDVEYVTVTPRGFAGTVVTRRGMYHLSRAAPGL